MNFRVRGKITRCDYLFLSWIFNEKEKKITVSQSLRFIPSTLRHEIRTLERQSRFTCATWIWRHDRHVGMRNVFEGWTSRNGITDNDLSMDFVHFLNPFFISKRIIPEAAVNRLVIHVKDCGKNYSGKMRPIFYPFDQIFGNKRKEKKVFETRSIVQELWARVKGIVNCGY